MIISSEEKLAPEEFSSARELLEQSYLNLGQHLTPEDYHRVTKVYNEINEKIDSSTSDSQGSTDRYIETLDPLYDATLLPVSTFPAFRALQTVEIFFLLLYFKLVLIGVPAGIYFRKRTILLFVVILSLVATALISHVFPALEDNTPYREIVYTEGFKEDGGSVVWPLVPYGENENIITDARKAPSWFGADKAGGSNFHMLGTDTNGRDVLARMVYGSRVSILIGIVAVSLYTVIGIIVGALAGYFGGWMDIVLSRLIEIIICFPPLLLILSVQAFLPPSLLNIILALTFLWWTGVARLQRGEFLRLVRLDFVQSVRALGGSHLRIIFLHILPNGIGPILVLVSFGIAGSILIESGLSFLGFGVPQPMASWGDLLNNGRNDIKGTWWLTLFPGLAIFITVTAFNLLGEGIRDALDPKGEG